MSRQGTNGVDGMSSENERGIADGGWSQARSRARPALGSPHSDFLPETGVFLAMPADGRSWWMDVPVIPPLGRPIFSHHSPRLLSAGTAKKKPAINPKGLLMFGLKRKTPTLPPFTHTDDCKILQADPEVEIQWSYEGNGLWTAECICTREYFREPFVDERVRQDPLDPATARHAGQCEYVSETDLATLKLLLRVTAKDGYSWVECSSCEHAWQVADYASPGGA